MRAEKKLLLQELQGKVESASSMIIAKYHGLNSMDTAEFRDSTAEQGGDFEVVRKRVLIKAAEAAGLDLSLDDLPGNIGIIVTEKESPVELTKAVFKFRKGREDSLEVLSGVFDSVKVNAQDIETLSKLPSMDELRAQFLGLIEAPMAQTVSTVDAALTCVLHCIENKCAKEETN